MKKRIAYLGPQGTFTEEALIKFLNDSGEALKIPLPTVAEVIRSVDRGEVDEGVVPIENSIEGSVNVR
jgi:prephenate dehydratase